MGIKGRSIFITGGAGFIANTLLARLLSDNQIVVFDNFHRDTLTSSPYAQHPNLKIVRGDVLDFPEVLKAMKGANIVVHAAGITGIDTVAKSPVRTMRVNMIGTANVLEAALQCKVSDRFIDFSTSEVFGSMAFKSTENSDTVAGSAGEARWVYAVSKLAGEHMALAYYREHGLPVVSVRPFNIYGPGQMGEGAIQIFIRRALKGADLQIHGDGNQIRAWCYVDDFVDCLLRCLEWKEAVGESFNIGNARAVITTYGLAQTICRVLNSPSKLVFVPALSAEIELRVPSVEKARQILKFEARVELDEGVRRTAEWVSSNK